MAISLIRCMTESERTLKMPKPESRMIMETTMPAERRSASKICRLPVLALLPRGGRVGEQVLEFGGHFRRAGGIDQLHQHEGGEVGFVQGSLAVRMWTNTFLMSKSHTPVS